MELPGLITVRPDQEELLRKIANMMGTSFMEEMWFTTWLSALDELGTSEERKEELIQAVFMDDLSAHVPYQGVYALPDLTAATGGYLYRDLNGKTHTELEESAGSYLTKVATDEELALLDKQTEKMKLISDFDWARVREQDHDHLYFYAWAVDRSARGTGALRRLLTPFFEYADVHGLNCYLECYSDKLQHMYEHIGFELLDCLKSSDFEVYERRMVRHPKSKNF